jgi:hypothetical protein
MPRDRRRRRAVIRAALLCVPLALRVSAATASTQILDYNVDHPWLGRIGTYVNDIARDGATTTVTSKLRVAASILGIVLHREDADRIEIWRDGRLVYFNGVTVINGKPFPVHGEARGNEFVVTSPNGTAIAPANVSSNNPWSCAFIHGTTIFAVNTGTVEPGRVTGGNPVTLAIDGRSLQLWHYHVESAHTHGDIWLNHNCVPVKESVMISGTDISLILRRETDEP